MERSFRGWLRFVLWGKHPGSSTYVLTRWLFFRALGVIYLIAIVSFWVQAQGLIGSDGILPVSDYLSNLEQTLGDEATSRLPTLSWLSTSDGFTQTLCAVGTLLAILLIVGVAPLVVLPLLWGIYLSIVNSGNVFMSFQWDVLLLETTVMALFFAPVQLRPRLPRTQREPSHVGLWLLRLLLFKLIFLSGVTKLISMDETWWGLTALDFHYYTQPLPTWTSWYAHQLPGGIQRFSVFVMFLIEIGAPFLIFLTRGLRLMAFWALVLLQLLIDATGNYNFFGLLTVALCLTLVDDAFLSALVPRRLQPWLLPAPPPGPPAREDAQPPSWLVRLKKAIPAAIAALVVVLSLLTLVREMARTLPPTTSQGAAIVALEKGGALVAAARPVLDRIAPYHSINGYGLFRSMTTRRPEIILEASDDGRLWYEVDFRWKPGDLKRRPLFVEPYQPRLDWQMWFAALSPRTASYWLENLARRILEGSPSVCRLVGPNLDPDHPPRLIRFAFYDYYFTSPKEREATGDWWSRSRRGTTQSLALENFR